MASELISAAVSGRSSEVAKDESSALELFDRSSKNSQIVHCNASYQQRDGKNSM